MAEQIRADINAALTAGDVKDKIAHLTAAKEWIIHRRSELSSEDLLDNIAELCSPALQLDAEQSVRHFVLLFIEELCRSQGVKAKMLLKPMEALSLMLEDENQPAQIARWALTTAAKIWKCVLYVIAIQIKSVDVSKQLKALLWRVKAAGVYTLEKRKDRAARLNAIKFIEVVTQSLYNDVQTGAAKKKKEISITAPSAPQFESLRDARFFDHPSLPTTVELNQEGASLLQTLVNVMNNESEQSIIRTACANSLVLIARTRPDARYIVVDALSDLVSATTSKPDQALLQSIKANSIMLLKSIVPNEMSLDNNALLPKVVHILRVLKADEHVSRYLEPLRKIKHESEMRAEENAKKMKDYPPQKNKLPTEGLHLLPIETLARLIVDNAGNVPKEPPPGHKSRPIKESQVLIGPTGLPQKLERVMALVRAVETGRGILNLPSPLKDIKAIAVAPNVALRNRESAFLRVCQASLDAVRLGSRSRGYGWAEQSYETCGMVAARLACDFEHQNELGDGDLKSKLIESLLAQGTQGSQVGGATQVGTGDEEVAALAALHVEFAADRGQKAEGEATGGGESNRYESFINQLLAKLLEEPGKNAKRIVRILREAPSIPLSALAQVLAPCENLAVYQSYFSCIRELILSRPTLRPILLDVLLAYATTAETGEAKERGPDAVRVIANKVYRGLGPRWASRIRQFAFDVIMTLSVSFKTAECVEQARAKAAEFIEKLPYESDNAPKVALGGITVDEEKAEINSRIDLYVALCASDAQLLPDLFVAYTEMKKRIEEDNANPPAETTENLKFKQRIGRMVDLFHAKTDKLWEKLAETNTVQKAFQLLQDFCPGSEDLVLRACQIFAKRDPDASVIPLCTIRAKGDAQTIVEKDARFLVPIVGSLGKEEAFEALRQIAMSAAISGAVGGDSKKARAVVMERVSKALENVVNGSLGRTLEPSELLVWLANMDTEGNNEALVGATGAFFGNRTLVTEKTMRKAFEELSEQEHLSSMLLRIMLLGYEKLPSLKMDALRALEKLAEREVWHNAALWEGFVLLSGKLLPESLELILRLPGDVFKMFVTEKEKSTKNFKELLRNAANQDKQLLENLTKPQELKVSSESQNEMEVEGSGTSSTQMGTSLLSSVAKEYLGL